MRLIEIERHIFWSSPACTDSYDKTQILVKIVKKLYLQIETDP